MNLYFLNLHESHDPKTKLKTLHLLLLNKGIAFEKLPLAIIEKTLLQYLLK